MQQGMFYRKSMGIQNGNLVIDDYLLIKCFVDVLEVMWSKF